MCIDLSHFTGTEEYHRFGITKMLASDGVIYLANECGAFWLLDTIASHQSRPVKALEFQLWTLTRTGPLSAKLELRSDSGLPAILSQDFDFTDFWAKSGLEGIEFFCIDGIILLPSEY